MNNLMNKERKPFRQFSRPSAKAAATLPTRLTLTSSSLELIITLMPSGMLESGYGSSELLKMAAEAKLELQECGYGTTDL